LRVISAFAGKFGAFFASIPLPIFAAIYCVLFGLVGEIHKSCHACFFNFIGLLSILICGCASDLVRVAAAVGISFIQFTNNNSMRNLYIIGLSLFLGISVPQYFKEFTLSAGHGPVKTNAGWVSEK